jgi:hypothetical protein
MILLRVIRADMQRSRESHVGLCVDEQELERLRERAKAVGCKIATFEPDKALINDALGVRWELNTLAYDDPPSLSPGARIGRWLDVKPAR